MCFPLTSFQLLRAWHQPMLHADKEQSYTFLETWAEPSVSKWKVDHLVISAISSLLSRYSVAGQMGTQALHSTSGGPQNSECCPTLVENTTCATFTGVAGSLGHLCTKKQNQPWGVWPCRTRPPLYSDDVWGGELSFWSQAWQSDGLWSPNNLVGNKPLWPRWQLHLSSPYQCPESLVTVTICSWGPERSRLTLQGRAWRDALGSSDCFGTRQDCRCLDGPW